MKKQIIIILLFLISFSQAAGELITPNDRVSNHVNVRQTPVTNSPVVGTLEPNQQAELIESVPYWYHIRLSDGIEGYASKAWTVILSTVPENTPETGKTDLIIGSWNIKWFGYYSDDRHDYPKIADIIQKFDLVAIQELRGLNYRDRLDKIISELSNRGFRYTYLVSQETGYLNNSENSKKDYIERYAFLWDIDRLHPVNDEILYQFVNQPIINNETFRQVPIVGEFKVNNSTGFDFRILTVHTVFSDAINHVRKDEIQFIHNWMIENRINLEDPEKNIFALGDFNANPNNQPHHFDEIVTGTTAYRVLMNEPLSAGESSLRTTIQQSNNPGPDYFLSPVYDHILVSNETIYAMPHNPTTRTAGDLGIVEFDQDYDWQGLSWNDVIRAMSDHRPVWFRLDYNAEDLD